MPLESTQLSSAVNDNRAKNDPSEEIFVNWPVKAELDSCDLMHDSSLIKDCQVAFFNPLEFALAHGLRSNGNDISEAEYISYTENEFVKYLSAVKPAVAALQRHLVDGGILVIRSNIPNSQLRIRKKSSIGTGSYTESLVSAFFWLEEFLGKYLFEYRNLKTIRFEMQNHPLRRVFQSVGVSCLQTQNAIRKGCVEVVANTGATPRRAAISKITYENTPGQVYLIPQFLVQDEAELLIQAFRRVLHNDRYGLERPNWLTEYESQLDVINPYRKQLDELDQKMKGLEEEKARILSKIEEVMRLVDLLVEAGPDLESAARTAMELIGFSIPEGPCRNTGDLFEVSVRGDVIERAFVKVSSSESSPIRLREIEELKDAIDSSGKRVKPKGILVGNASLKVPPTNRDVWFDMECQNFARQHDICLMPSFSLFAAASHCLSKSGTSLVHEIRNSIQREILDSDNPYEFNRKKYRA